MARIENAISGNFRVLSPLARVFRIVKTRAQRNRNLHELERLDTFMKEDIGWYK